MTSRCRIEQTSHGPIEFSEYGPAHAPALLISHGGHSSCRERLAVAPLVARGFRVIVPSRSGYGATPGDQPDHALFIALLDALEVERVHICGISAGGPAAIALAAEAPERVRRLVLASAITQRWLQHDHPIYRLGRLIFGPVTGRIAWWFAHQLARVAPRLLARLMLSQFSSTPPRTLEDRDVARFRAMILDQHASEGFRRDLEASVPDGQLERITAPTLVLHAPHDNSVPFAHAQWASERIPNARLYPVESDWGHLLWIGNEADAVADTTAAFLREDDRLVG